MTNLARGLASDPLVLHRSGTFAWRTPQRRPPIDLDLVPCTPAVWPFFRQHHYLTGTIHPAARCILAFWRDRPVAFSSAIPVPIGNRFRSTSTWHFRFHRSVCLPDFQGAGIGVVVRDVFASALANIGTKIQWVGSHPALIAHHSHSPLWVPNRAHELTGGAGNRRVWGNARAQERPMRLTASFTYTGPLMPFSDALKLLPSLPDLKHRYSPHA